MPINKILITHKFGIISQSHKRQLQERITKQRLLLENQTKNKKKNNDDLISLQINEEFVKEYNEAPSEKRTKLNQKCSQIFEKIKKKLSNPSTIDDLNVQLCWAELSQLMQCNSPIQEECMDLFLMSLEYARLSSSQIPTLFFLAETIIYWIRTDTVNQPFLRAFEIKLLKVGKLIFERIYIHSIDKSLDDQDDLKEHLSIYLQGFSDLKTAYSPYPDAFLYIEFMIKIGEIVVGSSNKKLDSDMSATPSTLIIDVDQRLNLTDQFLWSIIELYKLLNSKYSPEKLDQCLNSFNSLHFRDENWLDSSLSLYILAESSKINLKGLKLFLQLSTRDEDYEDTLIRNEISPRQSLKSSGLEKWSTELSCVYVELLTDICLNSKSSAIKRKALFGDHREAGDIFKNDEHTVFGLLDTAKFKGQHESDWMIRYMAIKGLVKICKNLIDKENEEFRQTSWACLVIFQESEKNPNVLEALKVGQINSKIDAVKKVKSTQFLGQLNVYSQIANRLWELKQMGLPKSQLKILDSSSDDFKSMGINSIPTDSVSMQNKSNLTGNTEAKIIDEDFIMKKKRTTLRDELVLSNQFENKVPNYYERKNIDLMRIVEDQYRKELRDKFQDS
ncbi:unnamed protein product [Brachionus calyciflorus]|uniref:Transmembrane protein 232 n=1 Tax=Brachionus calyciflorus TaxID=104777 RepID=A0A813MDH9_9BILA|nr:unnamed protein product [Brachionus calyciflorus]